MSPAVEIFTPETLAAHWEGRWTAAMIRDLCRRGAIPAKKIGAKKWIIPVAALAAWMAEGLGQIPPRQPGRGPTLPPYCVEVHSGKEKKVLDAKHNPRYTKSVGVQSTGGG
jgi:hypothetical protein